MSFYGEYLRRHEPFRDVYRHEVAWDWVENARVEYKPLMLDELTRKAEDFLLYCGTDEIVDLFWRRMLMDRWG